MPMRPKSHAQRMADSTPRSHDDRASAASRGYDSRWRNQRTAYLRHHPLCVVCDAHGVTTPATLVDHILPLADGGTNVVENLQSLCVPCHAKKTGEDVRKRRAHQGGVLKAGGVG